MDERILKEMDSAKDKAIDALARYKFWMFGYWAAAWVSMNSLLSRKQPNPFIDLVKKAREIKQEVNRGKS